MMITKQANALAVLQELTKTRMWHRGLLTKQTASELKRNLSKNKVSYENASAILRLLGFNKIQEEVWQLPGIEERAQIAAKQTPQHHLKTVMDASKAVYEKQLKTPMKKRLVIQR